MLIRGLISSLAIAIVVAEPTFAASIRFRVATHDAYAIQCRADICATLQVTHTKFSSGADETVLFFSAYDADGNSLSPFPFPSILIPSDAFRMNDQGTRASLNYVDFDGVSRANVSWRATGDFKSTTENITRVRDKRPGERSQGSYRITETAEMVGVDAEGTVGDITFATEAANLVVDDYGDSFLTIRKTVRVDRIDEN